MSHNYLLFTTVAIVDIDSVRTFIRVIEAGGFQAAGDDLGITQQAVSRRVAALEKSLGVRLLTRSPAGPALTVDGQAFLPHARELLHSENRAVASVSPSHRALRVDVRNRRTAPATLMHDFYQHHRDVDLDIVVLADDAVDTAIQAVSTGAIDATFRTLVNPNKQLAGSGLSAIRCISERHQLLVGPRHALAARTTVGISDLVGHPMWMPGLPSTSEVADYYTELAAEFDLTIDMLGPAFGAEVLLTEIAESSTLANLVGERSRYLWPMHYDLRRIPIVDPAPVYPMWMIWRTDNAHSDLARLLTYLEARRDTVDSDDVWLPSWARR